MLIFTIFLNSDKHKFNLKPSDFMSLLSIMEAIPATRKTKLKGSSDLSTSWAQMKEHEKSKRTSHH